LVGNIPLLGHWDPARSIVMTTDEKAFPNWTIKIDLPRDKIIEYKYLIIKKDYCPVNKRTIQSYRKVEYTWEDIPPNVNRIVNTHKKKEVTVFDKLSDPESIEEYVEVKCTK
jgi:hypothetical protein